MIQKFIYVTFQTEFIHQYKNAPDEVSFLRYPHRHIAHIKVQVEVFHNDREIEFIMLKHKLQNYCELDKLSNNSCETIAEMILDYVQENYGDQRDIKIIVSEDNENGCELVYEKPLIYDELHRE